MRAFACLVAVALASNAWADGAAPGGSNERVAVAVFALSGQPLSEEAQAKLRASLRGGLGAAGFEVASDAEVDKAVAAGGLAGCDTLSCLRRIGELVQAPRALKISIEVLGNTHVVSELSLIDLSDGKVAASAKDNCDVCTMKEVNDGLSNAAAALRMQLPVAAAPAPVAAAAPTAATTVVQAPPEASPRRALWIGLAGASAGLAAASVVSLGVAGAYDGRSDCHGLMANERCGLRVNGLPGIVIGAIGLPVFAVATGIFAWKAAKAAPRRVSLAPPATATTARALSLGQ